MLQPGIVFVIVIGGLKSRGLTKVPPTVGTEKIPPVEIPTIPGLSTLKRYQEV